MTDAEIEKLLQLKGEEQIYRLAVELDLVTMGVGSGDKRKALINEGKLWLSKNLSKIKEKLCNTPSFKLIISHETPVALVRAIADIIAHEFIGFPPFELSVILVNAGVKKICDEK